jgi:uncharacterized membrane protein
MMRTVRAIGRALLRRPNTPGVIVGIVFWWFSLVPSLMPRSWTVQAAISAICIGIGYALGTLGRWMVRRFRGDRPPLGAALADRVATTRDRLAASVPGWVIIAIPAGALLLVGCLFWVRWQDQQRDLLGMDSMPLAAAIPMVLVTVVLTFVLAMIGRLVGGAVRRLGRWNRRHLPGPLAVPATVVLVLLIAGFLVRDVAADAFITWADRSFSIVDSGTNDGTEQPTVSGSPESLVEWDDLGRQGRDFVAQATGEEDLRAFAEQVGADPDTVTAPVRAYAGMDSEDDVDERARLAVDDLVRAGGFDREVLVVATSTGTGWIDPDAARALELMHGGDTAIVSMQYSFLPSWISFITDLDRASEAGATLYQAVHDEWASRPADERPRLVAFGLSLGAYGSTAAFTGQQADTSIANIVSRADGALFVGTPYATELLRQLVDERDPGSPAWAPIIADGHTVRFDTRDPDQPQPSQALGPAQPGDDPRVLLFQHPSDPVVHWYYNWLWSPPDWMDAPRGFDVPAEAGWFPIVTGVQGVFDLMAGFSAPPGHGHDYRLDYATSWAAVAAPEGWTDDDTTALEEFTAAERAAQAELAGQATD